MFPDNLHLKHKTWNLFLSPFHAIAVKMQLKGVAKKSLSQDNGKIMSPQRKIEARRITEMVSGLVIPDRKLGSAEAFFHHVHEEMHGGFAVLCVYMKIAGPLEIQLIKHACHHLYGRHPLLRARISEKDDGPCFVFDVPFPDIPVHSFFELGKTSIHSLLEREADTPFDTSKHLWRVLLMTDRTSFDRHYLVISMHRSISDPASSVFLAHELVAYCAKILAREDIHVEILPVRPPMEDLVPRTARTVTGEKAAKPGAPRDSNNAATVPFHEFAPVDRRSTCFQQHVIEPAGLETLLERCGRNGTTVTGMLAAAALITMRRHFEGCTHPDIAACVDIRRLIGPGMVIVGPWCGSMSIRPEYDHVTGRSSIWELAIKYDDEAGRITSDLEALFADGGREPGEVIGALRAARQFYPSCVLADLGQVDPKPSDPFIIESVSSITGRRCAEHVMLISAAAIRSSMFLGFAYTAPLLRENRANRFISSFMHLLDKAGKQ